MSWKDLAPLELDNLTAYIHAPTALAVYEFSNVVDTTATEALLKRQAKVIQMPDFDVRDLRGAIFDYSNIDSFQIGNLPTHTQGVSSLTKVNPLSTLPVVSIIRTVTHEVKAHAMGLGKDPRRLITRSKDHALEFINQWNREHQRGFNLSEELKATWPTFATRN